MHGGYAKRLHRHQLLIVSEKGPASNMDAGPSFSSGVLSHRESREIESPTKKAQECPVNVNSHRSRLSPFHRLHSPEPILRLRMRMTMVPAAKIASPIPYLPANGRLPSPQSKIERIRSIILRIIGTRRTFSMHFPLDACSVSSKARGSARMSWRSSSEGRSKPGSIQGRPVGRRRFSASRRWPCSPPEWIAPEPAKQRS